METDISLKQSKECNSAQLGTILRTYKSICVKAKIENPGGLHTLRHTCASSLFRNGIDAKTISTILGHGNVQFTCNTYIHLLEDQTNDALEQISQAWDFTDVSSWGEFDEKEADGEDGMEDVLEFLKGLDIEALKKIKDEIG